MVRRRTVKVKQAGMILSPTTIVEESKGQTSQWIKGISNTVGSGKVPLPTGYATKGSSTFPTISFECFLPWWGRVGIYAGRYDKMVPSYSDRNKRVSDSSLAFRMVARDNFTGKQWRTLTEREMTEWGFNPEFTQFLQRVTSTSVYGGRSRHSSLTIDEGWGLFTASELTKLYEMIKITVEEYGFDPETNVPYAYKQFTDAMARARLRDSDGILYGRMIYTSPEINTAGAISKNHFANIGSGCSRVFNGKSELKAAAAMAKVSSAVKDGITAIVDTDKEMREELKTMLEPIQKEMQEALEKWAKAYDEKMTPIKEKLNADAKAVKDKYDAARGL